MDQGKHLQVGLLDILLGPQGKDEALELRKASLLEGQLAAPWLGSYQPGTGQLGTLDVEVGGRRLVQVQREMLGCSQGGRQGLVGLLEEEDLMYIKAQMHTHTLLFTTPILLFKMQRL